MSSTRFIKRLLRNTSPVCITSLVALGILTSCSSKPKSGTQASAFGTAPRAQLQGEDNLAYLMRKYAQGRSTHAPWAGFWFPFLENGTADADQKYETATGHVGAVQWELSHHSASTPDVQPWFGHCNGWSTAAVLFDEPRQAITYNGVTFGIGDQKALLTEMGQEANADYFGQRADSEDPSDPTFQDIFPDQFFLALVNLVGKGQTLILDRYTGVQVWNQPVAGYQVSPITSADDLGPDPSTPGVYRIMVTTQVWWLRDDVQPDVLTEPFTFADGDSYESRVFRFELWLDAPPEFDSAGKLVNSGRIIVAHQGSTVYGGAWRMSDFDPLNSHPDYLWSPYSLAGPGTYANPGIDSKVVESMLKQAAPVSSPSPEPF